MSSESLYDKYGGFAGISGVVHDFYKRIQRSQSLKKYFANTDMDKLIDHQIKFLCKVLGGPDNYDGRTLDKAHKMLRIDDAAFNEVGGLLKDSLEAAGVEAKDVQTILGVVESVRANIVTIKKAAAPAPTPAPAAKAPAPASTETLYDKYGGFGGISGVVHDFYKRILASKSLQKYFKNTDMDKLIDHQIKFLCKVLGGPDNYDGRALDKAHLKMGIDDAAFNEVGGHLVDALSSAGVEKKDIDTIVSVVESVRSHIVTVKAEAPKAEASKPAPAPASTETLYDKYGGFGGISGVVHDFYKRILGSQSLKKYFANTDMDKLIDHQIKFLCKVLGGPDNYDGRALDKAHLKMGIDDAAFNEVGGHLVDALSSAGVEKKDIDTIVSVVESVRSHIVTVKAEAPKAPEAAAPAPAAKPAPAPAPSESLYDKYGGFGGISGVVHDFYKRILASGSLKKYFANTDMDKLIDHQIKFLCKVLGGPDNYDGRALDKAHMKMGIDDASFNEVGGHLVDALTAAGVEKKDIDTIVGVVESVRGNIVTVKPEAPKAPEAAPAAEVQRAPAASSNNPMDRIPAVQLLDSAFALIHPKTLSLTYANSKFTEWTGVSELPCDIESGFDAKVFADVKKQMLEGKEVIKFECDTTPTEGAKIPVEYTLRWVNWREGRYILTGQDMSRVKEKDLMLKSFTQVIEVNNKKIKLEQRAVAELLDNMKQAVFIFSPEFKISPRYSKFVHKLFGDEVEVAGRNAMEFIFEDTDTPVVDRDKFQLEMNFAFANGEFQWDLSEMAFPTQVNRTINGNVRDIKLVFVPIFHEENLSKVMCVMEDMTEFNKAKRDAAEKTKELERVSALMAVNSEMFATFESEIWGIFDRCHDALVSVSYSLKRNDPETLKQNVGELFRHIHTIKGNARSIQLKSVQEVAHAAEEVVGKWRDEGTADLESLPELENQVAFIKAEVQSYCDLRKSIFGDNNKASSSTADNANVVELLQRITDAHKQGGAALAEAMRAADEKRQELSQKLRDSVMMKYDGLVQDIAQAGGKKANPIVFKGDIVAFSKAAKGLLNEILTHALRNSVDHGIETAADRKAKGKTEAGTVTIQFELIDNVHTLVIADDGQGLQMQKIRGKAVEKGLVSKDAAAKMTDVETAELLFISGFSTAAQVSEISGRGVGMDAVRKAAHELGGDVTIGNAKSGGTEVLVMLPQKEKAPLKKVS